MVLRNAIPSHCAKTCGERSLLDSVVTAPFSSIAKIKLDEDGVIQLISSLFDIFAIVSKFTRWLPPKEVYVYSTLPQRWIKRDCAKKVVGFGTERKCENNPSFT